VCSTVHDPAVVQHQDLVRFGDGGNPLGHDDDGGIGGGALERRPEPGVRGDVQGGEGVVKEVDPRFGHQGPGDAQALPLAAGNVGAALRDAGVKPVLLLPDKVVALRHLKGVPEFLVRGLGLAEAQVVLDGPGEEVGPLRHQGHALGDLGTVQPG
jgi:hypothetical protein